MSDKPRVLIVGADGADPQIVSRLLAEKKLPHIARLCERGTWGPLRTTFPPVSPVAWMTCLTGVPPAQHGIRDFVTKSADTYLPTVGLYTVRGGRDRLPVYTSRRTAITVGEWLSEAGRTAYVLKVPATFPPMPTRGGTLAGFGMPDLIGTFGVSAWYTTDPDGKRVQAPRGKDLIQPLTPLDAHTWGGQISGPARSACSFHLRRSQGKAVLTLGHGEQPVAVLSSGDWSGWVRLTFDVPGAGLVAGICRFRLVSLGPVVELYRTAVQCTPDAPLYALTEPAGFGARLENLVGPFATLGMPSDMDGVRRDVVDLDSFLGDAYANWEQQVEMTLHLAADPAWDLLVSHLFTLDNVQHLFWHHQDSAHPAHDPELARRYGNEIERAYRWMDTQVGHLVEAVGPDTYVAVVSDHGGVPINRLVYLNAWLQSLGYLVPRESVDAGEAARLDWDRTKAAMFGTGGIWLNVQGREPRGFVPPGPPYEALLDEISRRLLAWRDPETGLPVVKQVLRGIEVFGAGALDTGPDLIPAFHIGFGLGRGEGLGRVMVGRAVVEPNTSGWTGGHEGPYLPADVPGIGIWAGPGIPQKSLIEGAGLVDVAPTVLRLLGVDVPGAMSGRSLF